MKISIAMATYNGAKYIRAQLQSFASQTYQPDELIITDDCSTDDTREIILQFAETARFKVVFHRNERNLGYCGNFNAALSKTTGDLIFLSDQDDVWFPQKIQHMMSLAKRHPEALAFMNDALLTDSQLDEVGLTKIGQIRAAGFNMNNFVMGCCSAVRRELLSICLPIPDGYKAHDSWVIGFAESLNAKVLDETPLQYYRRHESNESQFIANRTIKVSKSQVFFEKLKSVLTTNTIDEIADDRQQLLLLERGIRRAKSVSGGKRSADLMRYLKTTQAKLNTLEKRIIIRKKPFSLRCVAALCLLAQGGYRNANGIKSMMRDVFWYG